MFLNRHFAINAITLFKYLFLVRVMRIWSRKFGRKTGGSELKIVQNENSGYFLVNTDERLGWGKYYQNL